MIVVDASAFVAALAYDGPKGRAARAALGADPAWAAPVHWKVEVVRALRGLAAARKATEERAAHVLAALPSLAVRPVPVDPLLGRMWTLRGNVTAHDAAYVAAAELLGCPLVTADARLARSGAPRCPVRLLAAGPAG